MSISSVQSPTPRALRGVDTARRVGAALGAAEARSASGTERRGSGPGVAQQAAVVQWGSEALRLARGAEPAAAAASESPAEPAEGGAAPGEARPQAPEEDSAQDPALQELRRRDREVRTHEQAHKSAGGAHAGSINLGYTVGPDGKRYATSGSVSIDASAVEGDPEATLRKMQIVQRAATAPADPSGADRQVASQAASTANRARAELAKQRYAEAQGHAPGARSTPTSAAEQQTTGRAAATHVNA